MWSYHRVLGDPWSTVTSLLGENRPMVKLNEQARFLTDTHRPSLLPTGNAYNMYGKDSSSPEYTCIALRLSILNYSANILLFKFTLHIKRMCLTDKSLTAPLESIISGVQSIFQITTWTRPRPRDASNLSVVGNPLWIGLPKYGSTEVIASSANGLRSGSVFSYRKMCDQIGGHIVLFCAVMVY